MCVFYQEQLALLWLSPALSIPSTRVLVDKLHSNF